MIKTLSQAFIPAAACLLLVACQDNSSSNGSGSLNLNVTDAPIDSAAKVVVAFNGVTIQPQEGPAFDIDFIDGNGNPIVKTIDLLDQQGTDSEPLLVDQTLDAGRYNWLRLKVISSQNTTDSYIELEGGAQHPLYIPSGDQTGLKLNRGFNIVDGGTANLTIDFDLRKSVLMPNNNSSAYKLKPTLRIVDNGSVGHINGTVGATTLSDTNCTGNDYAVYVFSGSNVTPDDVDGIEPDPVATALVSNSYEYTVGFLEAGNYTITFTCQANDDDSETNDMIDFIGTDAVTVTAGSTTTYNFN